MSFTHATEGVCIVVFGDTKPTLKSYIKKSVYLYTAPTRYYLCTAPIIILVIVVIIIINVNYYYYYNINISIINN